MKKTTNIMTLAIVAAITILLAFVATTRVEAAATDPYCFITYDSSVGCNVVKYYSYSTDGVAAEDKSRLVKYYNGVILLGTSNTVITSSQKLSTEPAWTTDGNYLFWIDFDGSPVYRKYGDSSNIRLGGFASRLGLNAECMVETICYADGSTKKVEDIVLISKSSASSSSAPAPAESSSVKPAESSSATPAPAPAESSSVKPAESSSATPAPAPTESSSVKPAESSSAAPAPAPAESSSVKPAESSSAAPVVAPAASTTITISNGGVYVAGGGQATISNDRSTTTTTTTTKTTNNYNKARAFVINTSGYSKYQRANGKTFVLKVKGKTLYLNGKKVVSGVKKGTGKVGFKDAYFYFVKGKHTYRAKISSPKSYKVWKKNKSKLTYSKKNGKVSGAKK